MLDIFWFSYVKGIVKSWLFYVNKFSKIIKSCFLNETIKQGLVAASFSYFLELLQEKNQF